MAECPYIEFYLTIGGWTLSGEAFPDTGFDGGLLIPYGVGDELITPADPEPLVMPNGYVYVVDSWRGIIQLDAQSLPVTVRAFGQTFLLGREVLDRLEICFEFGRRVRLRFEED